MPDLYLMGPYPSSTGLSWGCERVILLLRTPNSPVGSLLVKKGCLYKDLCFYTWTLCVVQRPLGGLTCCHAQGPLCECTWGLEVSLRDRGTNWITFSVSAVTAFGVCSVNLPFPHYSFPPTRKAASAKLACGVAPLQASSGKALRAAGPLFQLLLHSPMLSPSPTPTPPPAFLSNAREKTTPEPLTWQTDV